MKLKLKGGAVHEVEPVEIKMWQAQFPAVDVAQSLRNMAAWCEANPSRRKTPRGVRRFIVAWLMRESDKAKPREKGVYAAAHRPFKQEEFKKGDKATGLAALQELKKAMKRKTPNLAKGG